MYSVYIKNNNEEEVCIYNDIFITEETKMASPKLDMIENSAGTFTFKLPSTNLGYNLIERLSTEIIVKKKNIELWSGRVINIKEDFYKNRNYTCEGELAYLNDTTQPQTDYEDISVVNFLMNLIQEHNFKARSDKHFTVGAVGFSGSYNYIYTNYESTLKYISDIINDFGGFIGIRKQNGIRYIDYTREEDRPTSVQEIRFGSNLLDFTKSYDSTDFCTVLLPLGARLENNYGISMSGIEGVDAYTTIEDVNGGSLYLTNESTLEAFGWIEKVVHFDDIDDEEELLEKAREYLTSVQFDNMVLEVNAVDLGYLGVVPENIKLSDQVRVISHPHGLDRFFPVTKISIPLDNPANTSFTMGSSVKQSMSAKAVSISNVITEQIDNTLSDTSLLDIAKSNADSLINKFSTGYITTTQTDNGSQELYITDVPLSSGYNPNNPAAAASRYWRWNLNGLAYYNRRDVTATNPSGMKLGLTMDGAINADLITTGVLNANVVKAGILRGRTGNSYWNLDTGQLYLASDVNLAGDTLSSLKTTISATASGLTTEVINRQNSVYALSSRITQTENEISTKVTAGDVESMIEQNADSIRMKAGLITWQSDNSSMDASGIFRSGYSDSSNIEISGGNIKVKYRNSIYGEIRSSYINSNPSLHLTSDGGISIDAPRIFVQDHPYYPTYMGTGFSGSYTLSSGETLTFANGIFLGY